MDPGERGWLRKFLQHRNQWFRRAENSHTLEQMNSDFSSYEYLYHLIQPTGLMYGYPIRFIEESHPTAEEWSEKDKIKVLLAESYVSCGLYFRLEESDDIKEALDKVTNDIRDYYRGNYILYSSTAKNLFGRRKDIISQIEYVLDRQISIKYDWRNFWTSFFQNSLLFFDLINFVSWMEATYDQVPKREATSLKKQRMDLKINVLKVIAAAAHSDQKVHHEERELFNYFLNSAQLPAHKKRQAATFLTRGINIDELDLTGVHSWAMKKYFLELAILTVWANREISAPERDFLHKLTILLDLSEEELTHSMVSVEQFVMEYWNQVHYLQIKQNYRIVSERLIIRMRQIARKNQRMIGNEIAESRELVTLLRKSRNQNLTAEEKEKVREQLLDILKAIPAFAFLFLPGAFLTLPILLRIIPKSLLYPSSFRENE
jgi:hypothetical protein